MEANHDEDQVIRIDREHLRMLLDIGKKTNQSVASQIRESIECYIKSKQIEAHEPSIFSPIVFDPPYRAKDQ